VFYLQTGASPLTGRPEKSPSFHSLSAAVNEMTEKSCFDELLSEFIKVSAIRARKVRLAESGFLLLGVEVALSLILLAALAVYRVST
jgi:hypothetical protein